MKLSYTLLLAILLAVALFTTEIDAKRKKGRKLRRKGRKGKKILKPIKPIAPLDCGPIPHVMNGHGLATDGGIAYACQPGYTLEGTSVITCIHGRWTVSPRCVKEICPMPPHASFAKPAVRSSSGTSATYTCLPGYRIMGGNGAVSATIQCLTMTRSWPIAPVCEVTPAQSCGAPPVVMFATSHVSGNVATYTCQTGYVRKSGTPSTLTCTHYRWIYSTLPVCELGNKPVTTVCKAPPCGDATITRMATADTYAVGSKITYTCISGYRLTDSNNNANNSVVLECKSDGTFEKAPTCEKVDCGQPPMGVFTVTVSTTNTKFGDTYTYACITNYETGQSLTTTCQADGKWSIGTTGPTCTPKVCAYTALPTLTNGAAVSIVANSDTPVGNNVTFSCNSGYRVAPGTPGSFLTTQSVQCQANGTFTSLAQTCVYIYPSSCQDYYNRDNITPTTTSVPVMIDVDGATTTNSPVTVVCVGRTVGTQSQICTNVAPSSGQTLAVSTTCTQTTLTTLFADTAFVAPDTFGCNEQAVSYPLDAAQITSLVSSSNNCEQVVTTPCTAGAGANTVGRFAGIRRNGETIGTAYDPVGATTVLGTEVTGRLPVGPCDCGNSDSCTAERACTCTDNGAAGTDTITMALSGTQPNFVTNIGIVGQTDGAGTPAPTQAAFAADDFSISVGDIVCCSNV